MTEDHAPELDVTHARQARRGRHAFIILVTSLALVLIAFTAVYVTHSDEFAGQTGNREAPREVARTYDQQPAPVKQTADPGAPSETAAGG